MLYIEKTQNWVPEMGKQANGNEKRENKNGLLLLWSTQNTAQKLNLVIFHVFSNWIVLI